MEAAGDAKKLYERSTETMFEMFTLQMGIILNILTNSLSPDITYRIPLNRKTINNNIPTMMHNPDIIICLIISMVHRINTANKKPSSNTLMRDLNTFFTF